MWEKLKNLSNEKKAFLFLVIVMLIAALSGWYADDQPIPKKQAVPVAQSKAVAKVEKKEITTKVKVYKKSNVYKKTKGIPEVVQNDEKKEVVSVIETPPSEAGYEVTDIIDTETGEVTPYLKEKERSLFGLENNKEIGVSYGYSTKGNQLGELYSEWEFLRVGNFYVGTKGEILAELGANSSTELRGLVTVKYKFPKK